MKKRTFNYRGYDIRTIMIDREMWAIAKDVLNCIETQNVSQAVARISNRYKRIIKIKGYKISGRPYKIVLNKNGIVEVLSRSKKKEEAADLMQYIDSIVFN